MTTEDCKHPKLIKLENPEYGGVDSNNYICTVCGNQFTVQLTPYVIGVIFGLPK